MSTTQVPFSARGPLSEILLGSIGDEEGDRFADLIRVATDALTAVEDVVMDDDIQLSLFVLYGLSYGSVPALPAALEWDPELIRVRRRLEHGFETAIRERVPVPSLPSPVAGDVAAALFALTSEDAGPSLARHLAKKATLQQAEEFLIQRSVYTLREADPHSWAIPRLTGAAKAALVEIQADEYGGGRPERVHAQMFAESMAGAGLDATYGAYVDAVPAITLASLNMMSMFGLNRRLVGAIVGHLAAFEMTSSIPNRHYADGLRRLGYGTVVTAYFDEHVEADAVHEQIAGHDLAGALAEAEPVLLPDIMFGAAACLTVDGLVGAHILDAWATGASSLRTERA
ncbi:iron-containing redox enzyme family protein [Microbacterium tumbae]